jgi:hypothetical protein
MKNNWLVVDKDGFSKLVEQKGRGRIIAELIQNAWDEDGVTQVQVSIKPIPGSPYAVLTVFDDSQDGFHDLSHSFTLFAESKKKVDPSKRGRFNLGEKAFLSLCRQADIISTKGSVHFTQDGDRRQSKKAQDRGTTVTAELRITREQVTEAIAYLQTLISPENITTVIDGITLPIRKPIHTFEVTLPTEIADAEGNLRSTRRKTSVSCFEPKENEIPTLYEMGIPVVELGEEVKWHVDIKQKVPLNQDRDNVQPSYRKEVLVNLANQLNKYLTAEDYAKPLWVETVEDKRVDQKVFQDSFKSRFGDKVAAFTPNDKEANNRAVANGYTVLSGGSLSKEGWERTRESEVAPSAGKLFPTHPENARGVTYLEHSLWTPAMLFIEAECLKLAPDLIGTEITVQIAQNMIPAMASYGGCQLTFSIAMLGSNWFDRMGAEIMREGISLEFHSLFIHELAHHYESNHLSEKYYNACCMLGAKLALLARQERF